MKPKYTIKQIRPIIEELEKIVNIEFLGNGFHSDAFCVNNELVFKFPRHEKASDCLENEIKVLNMLQGKLSLEIPKVVHIGSFISSGIKLTFVALTKLKGKTISSKEFLKLSSNQKNEIAKDIATFLKELHSIEVCKARKNLVLLHGDFSLNHLYFENGKLSGVLDFADNRIGLPMSDFVYLLDQEDEEEFGKDFGKRVLKYYENFNEPLHRFENL